MEVLLWTVTVVVGVLALVVALRGWGWWPWPVFAALMIAALVVSAGVTEVEHDPHDIAVEVADELDGTYDGVFATPGMHAVEELATDESDGHVHVRDHGLDGDDHLYELTNENGGEAACLTVTVPHALGRVADQIDVVTSVEDGAC